MTDRQLYRLCKKYGRRALEARRRFAGLLPEVLRRRLYEKKGFSSIYEFAARLAGLTRENVDMVVRLERRFEGLAELRGALVAGVVSPHKLVRIASVATVENEGDLLEVAKTLSRRAVDVFVKDYRQEMGLKNHGENLFGIDAKNGGVDGLHETSNRVNSLAGQTFDEPGMSSEPNHDFEILAILSPEVKKKMKDMIDKGLDINKELMEFFEGREREIAEEKLEAASQNEATGEKQANHSAKKSPTRYIPAKTKKILKKEYGVKCAKNGCMKPAAQIHHVKKYALTKDNSPHNLQPLCSGHHEVEHMEDSYVRRHKAGAMNSS